MIIRAGEDRKAEFASGVLKSGANNPVDAKLQMRKLKICDRGSTGSQPAACRHSTLGGPCILAISSQQV
jgi:hypothetical protein